MEFKNYINGEWVEASTGEFITDRNPANHSEVLGKFPLSGREDVQKAVQAAVAAFTEWSLTPAPIRGNLIRHAADIFLKRKKEIAEIMTREVGKPLFETEGDVQEAIDTGYYAATEGRRLFGLNAPSELRDKMNLSFRMPVGPVAVITAWNFPIAVPSWKIFPALVAGNTVVFKPSEDSPLCANIFAEVLEEAGLPKGVFNVIHGDGSTGELLVRHPEIKVVAFTGSSEVGKHIGEICGRMNKKFSLEMGGKNGMIVMEDANLQLALDGVLWGAFGTAGQRCTATSRLILHKDIHDQFLEMLIERVKKLRLGNGLDPDTDVGPIINESQLQKIEYYIQLGLQEGAQLVVGGKRATAGSLANGWFFEPTIFINVTPEMRIFQEEIFGPVLAVTKADSFEHAIALINDSRYGLSSSIYTQDINRAFRAMRDIQAGITYVNGPTIGAEAHMPFGGVKDTGNGHREGGWTVFDIFTEWKTVYVDFSGRLQRAQIDIEVT